MNSSSYWTVPLLPIVLRLASDIIPCRSVSCKLMIAGEVQIPPINGLRFVAIAISTPTVLHSLRLLFVPIAAGLSDGARTWLHPIAWPPAAISVWLTPLYMFWP